MIAVVFILEILCMIKNAHDFGQVTGILVSVPNLLKFRKLNQIHQYER